MANEINMLVHIDSVIGRLVYAVLPQVEFYSCLNPRKIQAVEKYRYSLFQQERNPQRKEDLTNWMNSTTFLRFFVTRAQNLRLS